MKAVDRKEAGRRLGRVLRRDLGAGREDVVVIGLADGGVVVASEVARTLDAPLDVLVVRDLRLPGRQQSVFGAIGEGGVRVLDNGRAETLGLEDADIRAVEMRERIEVERQARRLRGERSRVALAGRVAVIVDGGTGDGSRSRAACAVARAEGAMKVVLAVPTDSVGHNGELSAADELVTLGLSEGSMPPRENAADLADDEVVALLGQSNEEQRLPIDEDIEIDLGPVRLHGHLALGQRCPGIVVFAHGSGSSRHSPRNVFVAGELQRAGLGTLLFDLLTAAEERDRRKVFDIELLAERLTGVTSWLRRRPETADLPIGYFGASTGAAAALWAAAEDDIEIEAVVSRGGRPDLADARLSDVDAPTLLIVGGDDHQVLQLNRRAAAQMTCPTRIWVVPGAGHLFSEPGALETVAELARAWFEDHLVRGDRTDITGGG